MSEFVQWGWRAGQNPPPLFQDVFKHYFSQSFYKVSMSKSFKQMYLLLLKEGDLSFSNSYSLPQPPFTEEFISPPSEISVNGDL